MQEKEGRRISMLLNDNNFGRSLTCEQIVKKHLDEDLVDEKIKEKKTAAQWQKDVGSHSLNYSDQLVQDLAAALWENVDETVCDRMK